MDLADFAQRFAELGGTARPAIVAINGHSSSGKTSLSRRLAGALPPCSVLHTDDLAWHHGVFAWDEILINDVLAVLRSRQPLQYRPPAWTARGREGAITLDGDRDFVIIEGVGASQASIRSQLDVIIWVQTPQAVREARAPHASQPGRSQPPRTPTGWQKRTPTWPPIGRESMLT